jgi:hypothetical protein
MGGGRGEILDFGFWILDFGLKIFPLYPLLANCDLIRYTSN